MYAVRIITKQALDEAVRRKPRARKPVRRWIEQVEGVEWKSLADTRRTYPHADEVRTNNGNVVTVFNLAGNSYRLIVAIHYRGGRVYVRELLSHAEYDKNDWKDRS
jgi:mRNA interferase HigB